MDFSKEEMLSFFNKKLNIKEIINETCCSLADIRRCMRRNKLKTPYKGFWNTGKKIGRPSGFKHTKEWKENHKTRMIGEKNPFYSKNHTEETKKLMSLNHADFSGDNNPFKKSIEDPKKLEEHKHRCKQIWDNRGYKWRKEFKKKLSKIHSESKNYKNPNFHKNHKSGFLETIKGGKVFYRSSWEKNLCYILDKNKYVNEFKLEPFSIKYLNENNEERFTRIDFFIVLLNKQKLIVEVKPKPLQNIGNNKFKIIGCQNYCKQNDIHFATFDFIEDEFDEIIKDIIEKYK